MGNFVSGVVYVAKKVWSGIKYIVKKILQGGILRAQQFENLYRTFIGGVEVMVREIKSIVSNISEILVRFKLGLLGALNTFLKFIYITWKMYFGDNNNHNDNNNDNDNNNSNNQRQNGNNHENKNNKIVVEINQQPHQNLDEKVDERKYNHKNIFLDNVKSFITDSNLNFSPDSSYIYSFTYSDTEDILNVNDINNNDDNASKLNENNNISSNVMISQVSFKFNEHWSLYYLDFTNEINNRDNGIRILNDILNKLKESLGNNYNINIQEDGRAIDDISNIEDISTIEMAINKI